MKASRILGLFSSLALVAATPRPMPTSWGYREILEYFEKWSPTQAYVEFNTAKIKGHVVLTQISEGLPIIITWDIQGLDPNSKRGFHVHESGNLVNGNCTMAGGHYNPFGKQHGGPTDQERHVGDLGNIDVDASGNSRGVVADPLVKLSGPQTVLGRSFVIHAGEDDLGKGSSPDSKMTGNAGTRPACGVILSGGKSF